ncbi:hypothetical protein M770_32515 (plasmid) [Pseudomonas aeruginosa VRFPA03]|nr:hypothetical protein M770_32515 [Pseudomonas aeruginosa VRFPA03]
MLGVMFWILMNWKFTLMTVLVLWVITEQERVVYSKYLMAKLF